MNLFKKIFTGKETEKPKEQEIPVRQPLTPQEMNQRAQTLGTMIQETLEEYDYMLNKGKQLNLPEYNEILQQFIKLAQDFEKLFELMTFDKEKLEEIAKYNEKSKIKREELKKQLSGTEKPKTTDKPPKK
jgi:hypothetical protein